MNKTVLVFTILIVFTAIAVWFVFQKTKEVSMITETTTPTIIPMPDSAPSTNSGQVSSLQATPEASQPIRYDNGLIIQDITVGSGKTAENGDTLSANYVGMLENGTVFDNSYDRGQPIEFVLGAGQLIKGWELGLPGMKEGGKRKLTIPPSLGYGDKGAGGIIPPKATLLFEIELVGVTKR